MRVQKEGIPEPQAHMEPDITSKEIPLGSAVSVRQWWEDMRVGNMGVFSGALRALAPSPGAWGPWSKWLSARNARRKDMVYRSL